MNTIFSRNNARGGENALGRENARGGLFSAREKYIYDLVWVVTYMSN